MKAPVAKKKKKKKPSRVPFAKRMATIVFEASVPKHKGKPAKSKPDFALSAADMATYNKLFKNFLLPGETFVSKSERDITDIMPLDVFMNALPRLAKARAITVTFWEHAAATPKLWRKVKSF
jgi:hypothetical protein